jgi:hypothetical protein
MHVPSTATSTQYWGAVAASSRCSTAFEETPSVGLPGTGMIQASFCDAPADSIWTIAVTVDPGLSTRRTSWASGWTGGVWEDEGRSSA